MHDYDDVINNDSERFTPPPPKGSNPYPSKQFAQERRSSDLVRHFNERDRV